MKSKLALAVLAALAVSTVHAAEVYNKDGNKLDLYGKVVAEHDFVTNGETSNEDATYVRFGFKGETQINDQLSGYGRWEYQVSASQAESDQKAGKTRLAFAGLKLGDAGSIDYGRNWGIGYDILSYTDNLSEFGGDSMQVQDNYLDGRASNVMTWRTRDFFGAVEGLQLGAQFQGKNEERGIKGNGEGYGVSLQYDVLDTGLTVGGVYTNSRTMPDTAHLKLEGKPIGPELRLADGKRAETWAVGTKYDANNVYLAAMYGETRNTTPVSLNVGGLEGTAPMDKTENFEAMAAYTFDFGLTPNIGYVQSHGEIGPVSGFVTKYVAVGATYAFNKNFSVDAGYQFNLLKDDAKSVGLMTDDQVAVAATYQF